LLATHAFPKAITVPRSDPLCERLLQETISIALREICGGAARSVIIRAEIISSSDADIRNMTTLLFSSIGCCASP
jgi:hypothetical protein